MSSAEIDVTGNVPISSSLLIREPVTTTSSISPTASSAIALNALNTAPDTEANITIWNRFFILNITSPFVCLLTSQGEP